MTRNTNLLQLIDDESTLYIYPTLAKQIGLNEALVIHRMYHIVNQYDTIDDWIILSSAEWQEEFPFWSFSTIKRTLQSLKDKGLICVRRFTQNEILTTLQTKKAQSYSNHFIGASFCKWCNSEVYVLHDHHFPIPEHEGGTETVAICPNCHQDYHYLETIDLCSIEPKFYKQLDEVCGGNNVD